MTGDSSGMMDVPGKFYEENISHGNNVMGLISMQVLTLVPDFFI